MNEQHIIRQILSGDREKYVLLVERYHVGLIIYCDQYIRNRSDAEDIAQKAFLKAYEQLSVFNPHKARFSTWLYSIARHQTFDHLKSQKRHNLSDNAELQVDETVSTFDEPLLIDVRNAVMGLMPPEQRRAIEAYYWEGKSYEAIAQEMHAPINTVRSWLRRAKVQLRSTLS